MARKIKTRKTAEQRRAEADALQARIVDQVDELKTSGAWQRFLDFAQSFHSYSINNLLLILAQMPEAEQVAGFRKWQSLGRQVRKGEKAIKIFGYRERKAKPEEEDDDTLDQLDTGQRVRAYFPMLSVFDISQTDPTEEWQDPEIVQQLDGNDDAGIYEAAADYMRGQGWTIKRRHLGGEGNGFTTVDGTKQIVIETTLAPAAAAKTMLHEAAHALMHAEAGAADYIEHRGARECEAESVAYIVAGILGLDTSAYSIGYVAGWIQGDTEEIKASAAAVLKTAHKLADALSADDTAEAIAA